MADQLRLRFVVVETGALTFQIYNVGLYNFLQAPKVAELHHHPPKIGPLRQKLLFSRADCVAKFTRLQSVACTPFDSKLGRFRLGIVVKFKFSHFHPHSCSSSSLT